MNSYEEQCKKWASKKFDLDIKKIHNVHLDFEHNRGFGGGCDTCGYGSDDCDCDLYVAVRGKRAESLFSTYLPAYDMPKILREIIEA